MGDIIEKPQTLCKNLGFEDFMRVPRPAHGTIAAILLDVTLGGKDSNLE